jgi:valyl-tRNA synthetase
MPAPKKIEMDKAYDASKVEDGIYARWEKSGYFNPDKLPGGKKKKPFTIVMPPPNATGTLHVGHAVMLALEDLMIRYHRMRGRAALWIPGTDHASIATQTKVEKLIAEKEKKTRHDLGRAEFLKRVEEFVKGSQDTIRNQIRKMGSSCDWSRERYTLDAPRSEAVIEMFNKMYEDGLMYRGERVVNWCVRCTSTLADDEVEYKEQRAKLYHLKYGPFIVATTRPETKLGDTAVAANPKDERYKDKIGTSFELNWGKGTKPLTIRVIGDHEVDPAFGSGLVGVTPAHSAVDFRMAEKNKLPIIKVIGEDGRMTKEAGKYAGMTVLEARHAFVKDLEAQGLVEKIEELTNNLSGCYRCGTAIEPLTSLQWFIDVNKKIPGRGMSLKELSLEAVKSGKTEIIPDRFNKTYFHWMENLRDWCVSRQLWFGHRIPAWYCEQSHVTVSRKAPKACSECGSKQLRQDEDTFDTWFSSGTWTFSTLGWPDKKNELKRFHPTQVLETGYDILFFWIARMILMTTYAVGEVPFEKVYLHGLVRDEQGRKMSKSLGNIIDPLDVSAKYGTDAVRLALVIGTAPGADAKISDEKIAGFRNFTNKLWNISRFVLTGVSNSSRVGIRPAPKTLADRWILSRIKQTTKKVTTALNKFEFSRAGELLYKFTWSDFADWYLEIAKVQMRRKNRRLSTERILRWTLEQTLKLWHPYMPFVTEAIWDEWMKNNKNRDFLMIQEWPSTKSEVIADKDVIYRKSHGDFKKIQNIITKIRSARNEYKVDASKKINVFFSVAEKSRELIGEHLETIKALVNAENISMLWNSPKPENAITVFYSDIKAYIPLGSLIDPSKERSRLLRERDNLTGYLKGLEAKLSNPGFTDKAPKEVVEKNRASLAEKKEELKKIEAALAALK